MPDDRVKVAGVRMSRQEAAEVEAERGRVYGLRAPLRLWPFTMHGVTQVFAAVGSAMSGVAYDHDAVFRRRELTDADLEYKQRFRLPVMVLGVAAATLGLFIITASSGGVWETLLDTTIAAGAVLLWVGAYVGAKVFVRRRLHHRQCRVAMRRIGWRVCTKCDYVIGRGEGIVCPECGTSFKETRNDA